MTQPAQQHAPPIYGAAAFRQAQDAALLPLMGRVRRLFHALGVPVTAAQRQTMAAYLLRPMQSARAGNYQAAVRYLNGQGFTDIPPLREYPVQVLEKVVEDATADLVVDDKPVTEARRDDSLVVEDAQRSTAGTLSRHAQAPARETVQTLADAAGADVGWARMLTGPSSCSFCAMLASRGPVYTSHDAAIGRGGNPLNLYHSAHLNKTGKLVGGNCDCIAVPVTDYGTWEGRESHQALQNLWEDSTTRQSNKNARNAFRREWENKVRRGETGDYVTPPKAKPEPPRPKLQPANERDRERPAHDPLPDMLVKANLDEPFDRADEMARINPRFKESKQWQINCTRCTTAVELRARGYDVTATPKPARIQDHTNRGMLNRWLSPDGKTPAGMNADINGAVNRTNLVMGRTTPLGVHQAVTYGPSSKTRPETSSRVWDALPAGGGQGGAARLAADEAVQSWGAGSRGFITVTWKRGRSGHVFNVENRDGQVVYLDGQNGAIDASSHWDQVTNDSNSCHIVRTDDLTPRPGGTNETGVSDWVIERTEKHLKADSIRQSKRSEKQAAAIKKPKNTDLIMGAAENGIDYARQYGRYKAFTDGAKAAETKPTVDAAAYSSRADLQDAFLAGFFWYRRWRDGRSLF